MRSKVEYPMRQHQQKQPDRPVTVVTQCVITSGKQGAPEDSRDQAMGVRIGDKKQRRDGRDTRDDLHLLPAEQQKDGPDPVDQLSRKGQRSQRWLRRNLFRRQREAEVTDEHGSGAVKMRSERQPSRWLPMPVAPSGTACSPQQDSW